MTDSETHGDGSASGIVRAVRFAAWKWPRELSARLACGEVVGQPDAVLGRLYRRWPAGPEAEKRSAVGALCLNREIPAGGEATYTFLLAWHFPNRTAAWSGWDAPKGHEEDNLGNYYCTRFPDAWAAAQTCRAGAAGIRRRTRSFVEAMRDSTLPAALRDAAMSNLSTLVTQTSFPHRRRRVPRIRRQRRQARLLLRQLHARLELRNIHAVPVPQPGALAAQGRVRIFAGRAGRHAIPPDAAGRPRAIRLRRRRRPDGPDHQGLSGLETVRRYGMAARTCGRRSRRASASPGFPAAGIRIRDGIMEGVQHNTYDVEFYGPNPLCGTVYYLGALRAAEEMARALGDTAAADEYRGCFRKGSALDRPEPVQRRVLHPEGARDSEERDRSSDDRRHGRR